MRDGKQDIHGSAGLKHLSWIAEDPNTPKPVFKANDAEMNKKLKALFILNIVWKIPEASRIGYQWSISFTPVFQKA